MNETELEKRQARAANETLVIAPTDGGFRVYNPSAITKIYMVTSAQDSLTCNCPDFEVHKSDPAWRCKHMLAVLKQLENQNQPPHPAADIASAAEQKESGPQPIQPAEKKKGKPPRNGKVHSQMLIKRSVSPDGRIDSLSVEFSNPIDWAAEEEIKRQAKQMLALGSEITKDFLHTNGGEKTNGHAVAGSGGPNENKVPGNHSGSSEDAIHAQLLNVAGMNTRSGWRLYMNVEVNGAVIKVFGSKNQLSDYVAAAGFSNIAAKIEQGMLLNLPCRVITKPSPDGKYLNIERVLPLKPLEKSGRAAQ